MSLQNFFAPQSLVVVGVSRTRGKLGHDLFENVVKGYRGRVYGINPHGGKVAGVRLMKGVDQLPATPDLALIMVPAAIVPTVVTELAERGVKNYVILSSGFREIGPKGQKLENSLTQIIKKYKIRLLGPNCLGFINADLGLNATFAPTQTFDPRADVALISQSGAMAVALLDMAREQGVSLRYMMSIGNRMDVDEIDIIRFISLDTKVKVIAVYSEALGRPDEFFRLCYQLRHRVSVVLLKGGSTTSGSAAALSHTGSLSQPDRLITAACRQSGVVRVSGVRQLFTSAESLRYGPRSLNTEAINIITNAGGPGIIAADTVEQQSLALARFTPAMLRNLGQKLSSAIQLTNPLDLLGDADLKRFTRSIEIMSQTKAVTVLIVTPQTMTPIKELTDWLLDKPKYRQNLVVVYLGGLHMMSSAERLRGAGYAVFTYPDEAIRHLAAVRLASGPLMLLPRVNKEEATPLVTLTPDKMEKLIARIGLPVLSGKFLRRSSELRSIKQFPVAMKIISSEIVHKAAGGGVKLQVPDLILAQQAWVTLQQLVAAESFDGIFVQPMARPGLELFIGARRDPSFGTIITFGLGGNQVEIINDLAAGFAPLTSKYIETALSGLRCYTAIRRLDQAAFIRSILAVADLMARKPVIMELDINPFILYAQGAVIVDLRLICKK